MLQALGLYPADADLWTAMTANTEAQVGGYYDSRRDVIRIYGAKAVTPALRVSLAHELTHALEDQWVELHRRDEAGTGAAPGERDRLGADPASGL